MQLTKCSAVGLLYTFSLLDALPILSRRRDPDPHPALHHAAAQFALYRHHAWQAACCPHRTAEGDRHGRAQQTRSPDRKSTRLNSSHVKISYAVFCFTKKIVLTSVPP